MFRKTLAGAAVALCAAALLGGCGEQKAPEPAPPDAAQATKPAEPGPAWSMQASATAGAALVLTDPQGGERLRIACRRNPAELYAAVPGFQQIGSEEQLTLGAGDELTVLVVAPTSAPDAAVEGTGALSRPFIDALADGGPVGVTYGAQNLGPIDAPAPEMARRFRQACHAAEG